MFLGKPLFRATILSILFYCTRLFSAIDYLDTTFGPNYNGIVTVHFGSQEQVNGVAVMSNGKIVAAGSALIGDVQNVAVTKHNTDGSIDTSFATSGKFTSTAANGANAVALDGSNNIYLTGANNSGQIIVIKLTSAGALDNGFGSSGVATLAIGDGGAGTAIIIDANSKVVIVGTVVINGQPHFFAARLNTDGSLDETNFNAGGTPGYIAVTGTSTQFFGNSVKIDGNAKIVVGGSEQNNAFLVARINANGTLDAANFNSGGDIPGVVTTPIPDFSSSSARSVLVNGSNKIIAVGFAQESNSVLALVKYNTDGSLDDTFGEDETGIVTTSVGTNSRFDGAVLDLDGNIVGVGTSDTSIVAARYDANGSLDTTFGIGGIITTSAGANTRGELHAAAVQSSDGRVVAGGMFVDTSASEETSDFLLVRYNKNNIDFVNITSIADNSTINTKIPSVSGTSNGTTSPQASVQVLVNGVVLTTVNTDGSGNWNAGQTTVLPVGENVIQANLIINSAVVVSHVTKFTVVDNLSEDAVFAYNTSSQTKSSGSAGFTALPFDNTPILGTWTYSSNVFTCNVAGRYYFEYIGHAGATSIGASAAGLNISMMASFATPPSGASEYPGSGANTNIDLATNLTKVIAKGFIKDLAAGDTVRLNFAVTQVSGGNSTAGLILHPTAQGSQYPYSLSITRIG